MLSGESPPPTNSVPRAFAYLPVPPVTSKLPGPLSLTRTTPRKRIVPPGNVAIPAAVPALALGQHNETRRRARRPPRPACRTACDVQEPAPLDEAIALADALRRLVRRVGAGRRPT